MIVTWQESMKQMEFNFLGGFCVAIIEIDNLDQHPFLWLIFFWPFFLLLFYYQGMVPFALGKSPTWQILGGSSMDWGALRQAQGSPEPLSFTWGWKMVFFLLMRGRSLNILSLYQIIHIILFGSSLYTICFFFSSAMQSINYLGFQIGQHCQNVKSCHFSQFLFFPF